MVRLTVALAFRAGPSSPSCRCFQDKYQEVLGTRGGFLAVLLECLQFRVPHDDHLLEPGEQAGFPLTSIKVFRLPGYEALPGGTVHHEAGGRHTGPSAFARCQGFGDYLRVGWGGEIQKDSIMSLVCTVSAPTPGTLGVMWPQWGWAFWREDIVGFVNGYTGGNCQKPLRGCRQDLR